MLVAKKSVLHKVDLGTHFSAAAFMKRQSTHKIWCTTRSMWNLVYIAPADYLSIDQGSAYRSSEMKENIQTEVVGLLEAPVETPGKIGVVERYYGTLRAAYQRLRSELDRSTSYSE